MKLGSTTFADTKVLTPPPIDLDSIRTDIPLVARTITYWIGDEQYALDLQEVMLLNIDVKSLADADLDVALRQCAIYHVTLVTAVEEQRSRIAAAQRKYEYWLAGALKRANSEVCADITSKTGKSLSSSSMTSITRQQLMDHLLTLQDFADLYEQHWASIDSLRQHLNIVEGVIKALQSWQLSLMSIAKRRADLRAQSRIT